MSLRYRIAFLFSVSVFIILLISSLFIFLLNDDFREKEFTPAGVLSLMVGPLVTRAHRLERIFYTWLTPLALLASVWDGTVSTFRCYTEAELRAMVEPLASSWQWKFGTFAFNALGRGTWFYGVPVA